MLNASCQKGLVVLAYLLSSKQSNMVWRSVGYLWVWSVAKIGEY